MGKIKAPVIVSLLMYWFVAAPAIALETINVVLTSKALQYVFLPFAQDRGYVKEEGIDLKIVYMQNAPGLQALTAGNVQFSGSGSSALVAISKDGAPLKTVLAVNDRCSNGSSSDRTLIVLKDLKGGKIATTGVASIAAFMFRNILRNMAWTAVKMSFLSIPGRSIDCPLCSQEPWMAPS
jgi:ABC-type nitrate/sulfonate/bicarbonate transport system substrate-binding protein